MDPFLFYQIISTCNSAEKFKKCYKEEILAKILVRINVTLSHTKYLLVTLLFAPEESIFCSLKVKGANIKHTITGVTCIGLIVIIRLIIIISLYQLHVCLIQGYAK